MKNRYCVECLKSGEYIGLVRVPWKVAVTFSPPVYPSFYGEKPPALCPDCIRRAVPPDIAEKIEEALTGREYYTTSADEAELITDIIPDSFTV